MNLTRREVVAAGALAPFALSHVVAAFAQATSEGDVQFVAPPAPPTDQELELLASAVQAARRGSASDLVRDERFMPLHPQPVFRQLVKAIARDSTLSIARDDEPGERIVAKGTIEDGAGHPIAGAIAYAYHTSAKGWYSDKAAHIRARAGDAKHARLFGYLTTDANGAFEIRTIRPGGYPRSTLPQHIHFEIEASGFIPTGTELLFDDDPRLTAGQREGAKRDGFIIAGAEKSDGPRVFRYRVALTRE